MITIPNSSEIDNAVIGALLADATLLALLPDGVYWDVAAPKAKRFVIVSLVTADDEPVFGSRGYEDVLYLVKAVVLMSTGNDVKTAAHRIDQLLEDQPLTIPGYTHMVTCREARIRYTEVDEVDDTIRWQHRGGHYRVQASIPGV
jgi:hypothetical protein